MSNSVSVAKNTLFLYIRMLFTLGVGLYTSRVSLEVLGIEDYGLYDVVSGVVLVFNFLQGSLSLTTVRFFSIALVNKDSENLKNIFNSSFVLHCLFALLLLIISETVGLWFLNQELSISEPKLFIANVVYQVSILSLMFTIIQIPYNAIIIAHERMSVFAFMSISEALLKLIVPFFLILFAETDDKLIKFSVLVFFITVLVRMIYRAYCRLNFPETKGGIYYDKLILKKMLKFFSWDLYKKFSEILFAQSVKINLNLFYGVVINSSVAIANQAQGGISAFVNNYIIVLRTQATASVINRDNLSLNRILNFGTRVNFFLLFVVCVPILFNADFVFIFWLGIVPDFAVLFFKLSIISTLISLLTYPVVMIIETSGRIKIMSFVCGTFNILGVILGYGLLKMGYSEITPYLIRILLEIAFFGFYILYLKRVVYPQFIIYEFLKTVVLPIFFVVLCSIFLLWSINTYIIVESSFFRVLLNFMVSFILILLVGFKKNEIRNIKELIFKIQKIKI